MKAVVKAIVVLLLRLSMMAGAEPEPQLRFLNNLVKIIGNQEVVETIITLQHGQDKNCTLQHWNSREIPMLRSNELSSFKVRGVLSKQMLAMVCIDGDLEHTLLNSLANTMENLRQERIILWTQGKPTRKFMADILERIVKFRFLQIIVLAMGNHSQGVLSIHRFQAFPSPRLSKVTNISSIRGRVFPLTKSDYKGLPTIVKSVPAEFTIPMKTKTGFFPISNGEDMEIIEFARSYNLDLRLYDENESDHFDIQLRPQFIRRGDILAQSDFPNPSSAASLIVLVPCSDKWSMKGFLKKLDFQTWLLYLLPVYSTFVLVECLVLVVTHRMSGQPRRLTNLNPLLNLRAFRAILGLPFPEVRRASLSLRQLSLAITIFGFIFSNCFSCKLSAILTKPLQPLEVRNFEELRDSGLTTMTDEYIHSFIENNIDPQFFNQVIPKFVILKSVDRMKLFYSLNDSFGYIIYTKNWQLFQKRLRSMGQMHHCTSKDLIIAQNLPRMYVLERNSVFKWLLSRFVMYVQEAGITDYWTQHFPKLVLKTFKITVQRNVDTGPVPLSLQQLKYLWHLLAIGYGVATVAFLVEIFLKNRRAVERHELPV